MTGRHGEGRRASKPKPARHAKCPICGKPAAREYRPFCSKACADIDLGRWLGGRYAVPGERAGLPEQEEEDT